MLFSLSYLMIADPRILILLNFWKTRCKQGLLMNCVSQYCLFVFVFPLEEWYFRGVWLSHCTPRKGLLSFSKIISKGRCKTPGPFRCFCAVYIHPCFQAGVNLMSTEPLWQLLCRNAACPDHEHVCSVNIPPPLWYGMSSPFFSHLIFRICLALAAEGWSMMSNPCHPRHALWIHF